MFKVPDSQNIMIHLRNWTLINTNHTNQLNSETVKINNKMNNFYFYFQENAAKGIKLYKTQLNNIISDKSIIDIENKFKNFINKHFNVFNKLPTKKYYLPLIIACYDRIFYSRSRHPDSCPGPLKCRISAIKNLNCTVAVRNFKTKRFNHKTKFYISQNEGLFISSKNGCYLG